MTVTVLDTSAFIMGYNPSKPGEAFSVTAVEDELLEGTMPHLRFQMFKDKGDLIIREPTAAARKIIGESVSHLGELSYVSQADREILALALDLKMENREPVIVSDDYAIQNLAEHLKLNYRSLANYGILHKFEWIMYCPACQRKYKPPLKKCTFCGTLLKRKVLSKRRVAKQV